MSFGGGGAAGTISANPYLEDVHGYLLAGQKVDGSSEFDGTYDTPNKSMMDMLNDRLTQLDTVLPAGMIFLDGWTNISTNTHDAGWQATSSPIYNTAVITGINSDPLTLPSRYFNCTVNNGASYTIIINSLTSFTVGTLSVSMNGGTQVTLLPSTDTNRMITVVAGSSRHTGLAFYASSDFNGVLNSSISMLGTVGNPYTGVDAHSPATALTAIDEAVTAFNTYIASLSETTNFVNYAGTANSRAASYFPTTTLTIADYVASAITAAAQAVADAYADSKTSADALVVAGESASKTNVASAVTAAISSIVTNIETLFNDAVANSNTAIAAAITAAVASAVSATEVSVLDDAVDEYEEKLKNSHMRGVNRFLGGMSDINAVNSSAFVFGLALMESDFQHDVAKFRADISMETYKAAFATYMDGFKSTLLTYLSEGVRSLAIFIDAHKANLALYTGTITEMLKAQLQPFIGTLSSHVGAQTQLTTDGARMRMSYSAAGIDSMVKMLTQQRGMKSDYYTRISEAQRIRIDAEVAEDKRNVELDYLEATWDLSLFQVAGGLLASMAGASGYVPNKPDVTVGSVLGGALSGASAGALATGGNPIGVLVGAVLGGGAATSQP